MSVKIVAVFIFLNAVICVKSQYQNYSAGIYQNNPGTQNWNSTGRQNQNYPGGQYPNYPGGQTPNYPRGQAQNYPGGQYQNYPGGQLPFKQNNFGVPSYNRTTPPSWQNRPFTSPTPYGKGSTNCTFGWCPNANGNRQNNTASNNNRFRPPTTPRPYGSGPANCSFGWCQNGNGSRPLRNNTTGYGGTYNILTSPRPFGNPSYGNTNRPPYNSNAFQTGPQNIFTSPRPYGNPSSGKNNYPFSNNTAFQNGPNRPYGNNFPSTGNGKNCSFGWCSQPNSNQLQWNNSMSQTPRPSGVPTNYPYGGSSSNCTFGFCPPNPRSPNQQTIYSNNPYGRTSTTYRPLYPGNSLNNGPYSPQQNTTPFNPYNPALYNLVQVPRNCPIGSSIVNGVCRPIYS